jgi:predicted phosphodiesterase
MNIQVVSDLHGEGWQPHSKLWSVVTPKAPVAVVAGDIHSRHFEDMLNEIATKFEKVIAVYGNHEFYHRDISWKCDKTLLAPNVSVLDCDAVEYDDVLFLGCTLWTDFDNADWFVMRSAQDGINDFHAITDNNGGTKFTVRAALEKHYQEKAWLKMMIEQNRDKKIVIVTHFLPSYQCVHPKWKQGGTDMLNRYFSANCDDLIEMCEAKAWIHGHTHDVRELELCGVPVFCNPLGYGLGKEGLSFGQEYKDMVITV